MQVDAEIANEEGLLETVPESVHGPCVTDLLGDVLHVADGEELAEGHVLPDLFGDVLHVADGEELAEGHVLPDLFGDDWVEPEFAHGRGEHAQGELQVFGRLAPPVLGLIGRDVGFGAGRVVATAQCISVLGFVGHGNPSMSLSGRGKIAPLFVIVNAMREWLHAIALTRLTTKQVTWAFRGVLVITVIDWLMPDTLPFVDELGLTWFAFELWRELKSRKGSSRDVEAEEV